MIIGTSGYFPAAVTTVKVLLFTTRHFIHHLAELQIEFWSSKFRVGVLSCFMTHREVDLGLDAKLFWYQKQVGFASSQAVVGLKYFGKSKQPELKQQFSFLKEPEAGWLDLELEATKSKLLNSVRLFHACAWSLGFESSIIIMYLAIASLEFLVALPT